MGQVFLSKQHLLTTHWFILYLIKNYLPGLLDAVNNSCFQYPITPSLLSVTAITTLQKPFYYAHGLVNANISYLRNKYSELSSAIQNSIPNEEVYKLRNGKIISLYIRNLPQETINNIATHALSIDEYYLPLYLAKHKKNLQDYLHQLIERCILF